MGRGKKKRKGTRKKCCDCRRPPKTQPSIMFPEHRKPSMRGTRESWPRLPTNLFLLTSRGSMFGVTSMVSFSETGGALLSPWKAFLKSQNASFGALGRGLLGFAEPS